MYMFTYFSKKLTFKNPYVILFQRVYILPLRNENLLRQAMFHQEVLVYILPLRNENKYFVSPCGTQYRNVYILPLRNENIGYAKVRITYGYSLYPTFKE